MGAPWYADSRRKLLGMLDEVKTIANDVFQEFIVENGTRELAFRSGELMEWSVTDAVINISKQEGQRHV